MSNENNKMQVDIDTLFKQNENDLCSIKELYRKIEEIEKKITQIKYIDGNLANKLKKEYEKLKKIILDENIQAELVDDIKTINSHLDSIAQQATKFSNPTRAWSKSKKTNIYESWPFTNGFYDLTTNEICLAYNSKAYHTSKTGKVLFRKKNDLGLFGEPIEICDGYKCHACGINALGEYIAICQDITGEHGFDGGLCYSFKSNDKGKTWTNAGKLNVTNVTINEVEPITGMKLMKDGSLF